MNPFWTLILKGMAMGIAEVIPGVSGGTLAFITGIYERLLHAIAQAFSPNNLHLLRQKKWKKWWSIIDGYFLLNLLAGMVLGIGLGVVFVTRLLASHPPVIWAFFFGLIIGSAVYISNKIKHWSLDKIVGIIVSTLFAVFITSLPVLTGNTHLWYVFLSGVIAISALVLPGISGSFMLLIMGMYLFIIDENLKGLFTNPSLEHALVLVTFGLGALLGLVTVVRGLNYLLEHYHDLILSILTGFMIGSLNKIWPWKNVTAWLDKSTLKIMNGPVLMDVPHKIIQTHNVWPNAYEGGDPMMVSAIVAFVAGLVFVLALERMSVEKITSY